MPRQPQAVSGLFGETPQAIRQSQIDERINRASMIGNLTPGGHGALAGGMLARGISGLMGAAEDPRLRKAQIYQEIEQNITQMGLRPGTPEFTRAVTQQVTGRLGTGAGIEAQQKAQQLEVQRAEVESLRGGPAQAQRKADAQSKLLNRQGYSENDAQALVEAGIADAAIKQGLKPKELTEKLRTYIAAYGGDVDRAMAALRNDLGKGMVTVVAGGADFQTEIGKTLNDLVKAQKLPPSKAKDKTVNALALKLQNQGKSAEALRSDIRMEAVYELAQEFNVVAEEYPEEVGSIGGVLTKIATSDGFFGVAYRLFASTTASQSEMSAKEAQMRALLGTALSGAAIPKSEWPVYQAQVPSVTDDAQLRAGKVVAYGDMMTNLARLARAKEVVEESAKRPADVPLELWDALTEEEKALW